ncbi:MAG: alpha/beta hydrolase [Elusimicrobiaceae bacterium]|nr:alpha/beta hydrolase [Elusimicrobiaceae bacterium]
MKNILVSLMCLAGFVCAAHAESTGEILTFPARPEKGFEWGYALYLPEHMDTSKKLPILLTMNNEDVEESVEELENQVRRDLRRNYSQYGIADGVGVPMLVPLLLQDKEPFHTRQLNRAVFKLQDGPFAHLDRQVLAMLNDARQVLQKRGIRTKKKFLVAGFSTPGVFAWHFAMLQPEHVLAGVVGGHQNPMLPLTVYNGVALIYPVGVQDVPVYAGRPFNKRAWRKIPLFVVSGGDDYNDPLPYNHVYGEEERAVFNKLYGEGNLQSKWRKAQEILSSCAPNVQLHTYPNLGHEAVWSDQIEFLKKHLNGGPLHPITPTDTSDRPSLLPFRVTGLYWGKEAPVKSEREYLGETDLVLQVDKKDVPYWIGYKSTWNVDILHQDQPVLEEVRFRGGWLEDGLIQVSLSDEDVAKLRSYKDRTFSMRSHHPEILDIPADLTFTVR